MPDRLEFDLTSPTGRVSPKAPATVDGRRAASSTARRQQASTSKARSTVAAAKERAGFAGYEFGLADEEVSSRAGSRSRTCRQTDDAGKAKFTVSLDKLPASTPARSEDHGAHGRSRRPRGRAHHHAAGERERRR